MRPRSHLSEVESVPTPRALKPVEGRTDRGERKSARGNGPPPA